MSGERKIDPTEQLILGEAVTQARERGEDPTTVEEILRPLVESGDSRFEALRLGRYQALGDGVIPGWRVDASLGAIVRAAAACGWSIKLRQHRMGWEVALGDEAGHVAQVVTYLGEYFGSPEEAVARALAQMMLSPWTEKLCR